MRPFKTASFSPLHAALFALGLSAALLAGLNLGTTPGQAAKSFSGYKVPRFVTLGATRVNVRSGPSKLHPIQWQYVRLGLPVEVVAETEQWRRIRDWQGDEGWVFHTLLSGKRSLLVIGDGSGRPVAVRAAPKSSAHLIAVAEPGALGHLMRCQPNWCRLNAQGITGWVHRSFLWGVLPDETQL